MEKEKFPIKITITSDGQKTKTVLNNMEANDEELLAMFGGFATLLIQKMTSQGMTFSEAVEEVTHAVGTAVVLLSEEMPNQDFFPKGR